MVLAIIDHFYCMHLSPFTDFIKFRNEISIFLRARLNHSNIHIDIDFNQLHILRLFN